MPKKKKFPKGKAIAFTDFFGMHHEPAVDSGDTTDDERSINLDLQQERLRQKTASSQAAALATTRKQQIAVILGEEHDHRTYVSDNETKARFDVEETISEQRIEREWTELQIARHEERKRQALAKQAAMTQFGTQQMLTRADIADKQTEEHLSLFNRFRVAGAQVKQAAEKRPAKEKLEADRRKAAERAKAYEERAKQAKTNATQKIGFFKPEPEPLYATAPTTPNTTAAKETEKKAGWWPW